MAGNDTDIIIRGKDKDSGRPVDTFLENQGERLFRFVSGFFSAETEVENAMLAIALAADSAPIYTATDLRFWGLAIQYCLPQHPWVEPQADETEEPPALSACPHYAVLDRLPPSDRAVFLLLEEAKLPFADVGVVCQLPAEEAASVAAAALDRLAAALLPEGFILAQRCPNDFNPAPLLFNHLDAERRRSLQAHLMQCFACRTRYVSWEETLKNYRRLRDDRLADIPVGEVLGAARNALSVSEPVNSMQSEDQVRRQEPIKESNRFVMAAESIEHKWTGYIFIAAIVAAAICILSVLARPEPNTEAPVATPTQGEQPEPKPQPVAQPEPQPVAQPQPPIVTPVIPEVKPAVPVAVVPSVTVQKVKAVQVDGDKGSTGKAKEVSSTALQAASGQVVGAQAATQPLVKPVEPSVIPVKVKVKIEPEIGAVDNATTREVSAKPSAATATTAAKSATTTAGETAGKPASSSQATAAALPVATTAPSLVSKPKAAVVAAVSASATAASAATAPATTSASQPETKNVNPVSSKSSGDTVATQAAPAAAIAPEMTFKPIVSKPKAVKVVPAADAGNTTR